MGSAKREASAPEAKANVCSHVAVAVAVACSVVVVVAAVATIQAHAAAVLAASGAVDFLAAY